MLPETSEERMDLRTPSLAKLTLTPFKASGAMVLIRPQNGTGLQFVWWCCVTDIGGVADSLCTPFQQTKLKPSEVMVSTGLILSSENVSSGHHTATKKNV